MHNGIKIIFVFMQIFVRFDNTASLNYCSNPVQADNVGINWFNQQINKDWRIQVGNTVLRDRIAKYVNERDVNSETDFTGICPTESIDHIDDTYISGKFGAFGKFGDQRAHWNCSTSTNKCEFFSVNKVFKETGQFYTSRLEFNSGHYLVCYVVCFENGDVGWYASTRAARITDEDMERVLQHFKSLGFNTRNNHILASSKCA